MRNYLIPANTKRGKLIMGIFTKFDLVLLIIGVAATFILLTILPLSSAFVAIFALLPAMITGFLVFPIPNYHNVLNILVEMYEFVTSNQTYIWKGWCYKSEYKKR